MNQPPPVQRLAWGGRAARILREQTFRSLRHRNYRLYFFGQIVSFTGSWMQSAALMWLVYDLTADPMWPSILLVAQIGPTLLLGPAGGTLADYFEKRLLVVLTQSCFLAIALLLLALTATGTLEPWWLFGIMLVNGCIQALDLPTRLAFVPTLIPREDLINAVSLNALLFNAARAVGPALAGLTFLLADWLASLSLWPRGGAGAPFSPVRLGAMLAFAFNAGSFVAVLFALSRIRGLAPPPARRAGGPQGFFAGFRVAFEDRVLRRLLLLSGGLCIFAWPTLTLFPAYTRLVLERAEKEYSILVSALGLGALGAAMTTATFGQPPRQRRFLLLGAGLTTLGLAGLATANHPALALPAASLLGYGLILYLSTGQAAVQLLATESTRGRIMALWAMMLSASAPIGHLVAGRLAQSVPPPWVFAGMATGAALVALAWWPARHSAPGTRRIVEAESETA